MGLVKVTVHAKYTPNLEKVRTLNQWTLALRTYLLCYEPCVQNCSLLFDARSSHARSNDSLSL